MALLPFEYGKRVDKKEETNYFLVIAILRSSEVPFLDCVYGCPSRGRRLLAIADLFKKAAINQSSFTMYSYTVIVKIYKHR